MNTYKFVARIGCVAALGFGLFTNANAALLNINGGGAFTMFYSTDGGRHNIVNGGEASIVESLGANCGSGCGRPGTVGWIASTAASPVFIETLMANVLIKFELWGGDSAPDILRVNTFGGASSMSEADENTNRGSNNVAGVGLVNFYSALQAVAGAIPFSINCVKASGGQAGQSCGSASNPSPNPVPLPYGAKPGVPAMVFQYVTWNGSNWALTAGQTDHIAIAFDSGYHGQNDFDDIVLLIHAELDQNLVPLPPALLLLLSGLLGMGAIGRRKKIVA